MKSNRNRNLNDIEGAESARELGPVEITLYSQLLDSVCEEMGIVLQKSALSPNIKERRDFSTALFDASGGLAAQGTNIPVHLGSMPMSAKAAIDKFDFSPGDVVVLNDPFQGGTHLPDITMVAPFFIDDGCGSGTKRPAAYIANRAHHADVGGMTSGSIPLSTEIYQEGLILPPLKLVENGRLNQAALEIICANSRTPDERSGDIQAQIASLARGASRLAEICRSAGIIDNSKGDAAARLSVIFGSLQRFTERALNETLSIIKNGIYSAKDFIELPDGDLAEINVFIEIAKGKLIADFGKSSKQTLSPYNAVRAITVSATAYALRCLLAEDVPTNAGLMRPVYVITNPGTIVDALPPCAVSAGNVETSQRIVDVLFQALSRAMPEKIPATSLGTMNNVTAGGIDARSGAPFAYYETIGGGHGACAQSRGLSARHAHMTNSLNTPVESLEYSYPLRVIRYEVRKNSGGRGKLNGGEGIVREIEFLCEADACVIGQRVKIGPPGLNGGEPGKCARYRLKRASAGPNAKWIDLPAAASFRVSRGDLLRIETPGGGGFGKP